MVPIPKTVAQVVKKIIDSRQVVMSQQQYQGSIQHFIEKMVQSGKFKIKRAYKTMMPQLPKVTWKNLTLHKQVHPRLKFILWMATQQRLKTVVRLQKIGIPEPINCIFCDKDIETFDHPFFSFTYSNQVWRRRLNWLQIRKSIGT